MNQGHNSDDTLLEAHYSKVGEAAAGEWVSESLLRERREEAAREEQEHE